VGVRGSREEVEGRRGESRGFRGSRALRQRRGREGRQGGIHAQHSGEMSWFRWFRRSCYLIIRRTAIELIRRRQTGAGHNGAAGVGRIYAKLKPKKRRRLGLMYPAALHVGRWGRVQGREDGRRRSVKFKLRLDRGSPLGLVWFESELEDTNELKINVKCACGLAGQELNMQDKGRVSPNPATRLVTWAKMPEKCK